MTTVGEVQEDIEAARKEPDYTAVNTLWLAFPVHPFSARNGLRDMRDCVYGLPRTFFPRPSVDEPSKVSRRNVHHLTVI